MILHYRESENIVVKKTKDITEEEKQKYKAFLEGETGIFIIEKLTRDIIEHCKLRLIKNLITENQILGLKIIILLLKLMKEIMNIMTQMMKKKEKTCLKSLILKFFDVIPMILILIFLNF